MVEHSAVNRVVAGSSPVIPAIKTKYAEFVWAALRRRSIFMRKSIRKRREQYFRNF